MRAACRSVVPVLALTVAMATGCATVPTSGPVQFQAYGRAGEEPEGADVEIMNVAPQPGDSPVQVVRGFLSTMLAYQPEHPMARQFLTPRGQAEWQPGRRVLVHDQAEPVPSEQENVVLLSGTKVGALGEDRGWRPAAPGAEVEAEFRLKKIDGEWRIDQVPDKVFMTRSTFEREFLPYNLYFYDPEFKILVPDPVYLPKRGREATTLVNAVLEGPTDWLEPVVRTVAPSNARLQVPSVEIPGEVARIEVSESIRDLTEKQRRLLASQLAWTLSQTAEISRVRLLVDGVPLDVFDDSTDPSAGWRRYDPDVADALRTGFVIHDRRVHAVEEGGLTPRPRNLPELPYIPEAYAVSLLSGPVKGLDPIEPASTVDRLVLVGEDGRSLWMHSGEGKLEPFVEDFDFHEVVSLSWDRTGKLWVVDQEDGEARIVVVDGTGAPRILAVPHLTGEDVRELRVSRDGMRVAALVGRGPSSSRTQVYVGLIERSKVPVIRSLRPLETGYSRIADIAWSDHAKVVVVGQDAVSTSHVAEVRVDGSLVEPVNDAPAAPVAVAASPGRPMLVVDADGAVYLDEDDRAPWRSLGRAVQPVYAG